MLLFFVSAGILLFVVLGAACQVSLKNGEAALARTKVNWGIYALVAGGLLLRILTSGISRGYSSDMSCFVGWSDAVFKSGFSNFYGSVSFSDYPPGYMYILYLLGGLRNLFSMDYNSFGYNLLLKLPSMLADILCGVVAYRFAMKKQNQGLGLLAAALFIFNPMVLLNSTWWGQVDSVFTLLILLSLIELYEKKHIYSAVLYALALLVKPQAVIVFPVFLFYIVQLIRSEKGKGALDALWAALAGAAVFFCGVFPFFHNPLDVFGLYLKTLSSYEYATLNTPNLFGLFGGNGQNLYGSFLFMDYNRWSYVFILAFCVMSAVLFFRNYKKEKLFSVSAFLICGMYVLSAKMHERYVFPALAFLLFYYVATEKRMSLVFYGLFSFVAYMVTAWVLSLDLAKVNPWISSYSPMFLILSLLCVVSFIWMTVWLYHDREKRLPSPAVKPEPKQPLKKQKGKKKEDKTPPPLPLEAPAKRVSFGRADAIVLLSLMAVYTAVAFFNLGDTKAPETMWDNKYEDAVLIDLGSPKEVGVFNLYNGSLATLQKQQGSEDLMNQYRLEGSLDGSVFDKIDEFSTSSVFRWESKSVEQTVRYFRLTAVNSKESGQLGEVAVYDGSGNRIPIALITDRNGNGVMALYDEQDKAVFHPSYSNGTYFDEIYHARTAYEHLHGIEAYEWTHPPLGKLIIAAGVQLFGMTPFGWRFMGTLFGVLMLPLMYLLAKQMFRSTKLGGVGTLLLGFDFMHFTQTRVATIDTYATFFIMVMFYFMYRFYQTNYHLEGTRNAKKHLFWAGLFFGIGAASKWTCIYAGAGLAVVFVIYMVRRYLEYKKLAQPQFKNSAKAAEIRGAYVKNTVEICLWCVAYFVLIPLCIYWLAYLPYAFLKNNHYSVADIMGIQQRMYDYHSALKAEHPFSSQWYTWPVMKRPIWYFSGGTPENNTVSSIAAFGNPAVWWVSLPATFAMIGIGIRELLQSRKAPASDGKKSARTFAGMLAVFLLVGYLAEYMPWMGVKRLVFIYHYFTSVPFLVLMITYVAWYLYQHLQDDRQRKIFDYVLYAYLAVVLGLFIMFYPVLSGFEVPKTYIKNFLNWFPTWILGG